MTIIELFDALDDLIPSTRDGNTTKRIAQLRNQAEALERDHSTLQSLYVALQQEKAKINKELSGNKSADAGASLSEIAKQFIKHLSASGGSLGSFHLQNALGIGQTMVRHHADTLSDAGLIEVYGFLPDGGITWGLTQKGRAYAATTE